MKGIIITILLFCCIGLDAKENDFINHTPVLMVKADSMPVSSGQLIVLPYQGLFVVEGNTFYSLDTKRSPDIEKIRLLEKIPFEHIIVNDNEFIGKYRQFLMQLGEDRTEMMTEFDTENFSIFSGRDSVVNIVTVEDNDSSVWYKLDRRTGETECIIRNKEPIRKIVAGNHLDFCIIGNNIYYVNDEQCGELVVSEQPILDMVLLPFGLMFCTDDKLFLIEDDCVVPMGDGDFQGLLSDGNVVYVVMKNGNIWRLE